MRERSETVSLAIRGFREDFEHSLPAAALASLDDFEAKTAGLVSDTGGTKESLRARVQAALIELGAFESELSFLLSDVQAVIRARSERAFSHLQRSIVADRVIRERWNAAFDEGEVACEALAGFLRR